MSFLKQPVGQIRLTNVAVVKLKSHGLRFEVACYRNKILNYRAGIESDLDEVLQTQQVFTNVSKGQVAKDTELIKAFGTADVPTCCRFVLEKGEDQVSEEERQAQLAAIFRDVCTVVASRCINPRSGLPVTLATVSNALTDCGFSTRFDEITKKQALRAIELLCTNLPDHICRAPMRIRITSDLSQRLIIRQKLHQFKAKIEEETPAGLPAFQPAALPAEPEKHTPAVDPGNLPLPEDRRRGNRRLRKKDLVKEDFAFNDSDKASDTSDEHSQQFERREKKANRFALQSDSDNGDTSNGSSDSDTPARQYVVNTTPTTAEKPVHIVESDTGSPSQDDRSANANRNAACTPSDVPVTEAQQLKKQTEESDPDKNRLSAETPEEARTEVCPVVTEVKGTYCVMCLCDPNVYRPIEELVSATLIPSGRLIVVEANVKEARMEDCLDRDDKPTTPLPAADQTVVPTLREGQEVNVAPGTKHIKCSTCHIEVPDGPAYRKHCRTEWHSFNVKRSVRELLPISYEEFSDLSRDLREGFLAVE